MVGISYQDYFKTVINGQTDLGKLLPHTIVTTQVCK